MQLSREYFPYDLFFFYIPLIVKATIKLVQLQDVNLH
jgi:hypothetical protein